MNDDDPTSADTDRPAPSGNSSSPLSPRRHRDRVLPILLAIVVVLLGIHLLIVNAGTDKPDTTATTPTTSAPTAMPAATVSGSDPMTAAAMPPTGSGPSTTTGPDASTAPSDPVDGQKATPIGPLGDLARRTPGDPLAQGAVDAPVVMVMFSDYRCPFCAQFSRTTEPELVSQYVDTGVLRIEWRDMPIFGDESTTAAAAGRAAAAQGRFWEFTAAVYAAAPDTGHPDLSVEDLTGFAAQAGVADLDKFRSDLTDPTIGTEVAADLDQATQIGVPSTPAFVINGYPLVGAQPLSEFTTLIDTVQTLS